MLDRPPQSGRFWWGSYDSEASEMVASTRLHLEKTAMKADFGTGTVKQIIPGPNHWDSPYWYRVTKIDFGFDAMSRLYFMIKVQFGDDRRGKMRWEDETYLIKIVYPVSFPAEHPKAYTPEIHGVRITKTPHVWGDDSLCLFRPGDGRGHGWDPSRDSGASVGLWSIDWIRAYRHWKKHGGWPGEDGH